MTSEAIAITAIGASEEAIDFAALVEAEQAGLHRIAARLLRDDDDARDLVQTTFAVAYERMGSLRDPALARAWLRRILVTRALNQLRRRRVWRQVRELFGAADVPEPAAPGPAPDTLLMNARRLESVARLLDALPAKQATAFTLRYLEGLDLEEVAAAMGIGRGTVKTHLHRALSALRLALGEREEAP